MTSSDNIRVVFWILLPVEHRSIMPLPLLGTEVKVAKTTTSSETPGPLLGETKDTSRSLLLKARESVVSNRFHSSQLLIESIKYLILMNILCYFSN